MVTIKIKYSFQNVIKYKNYGSFVKENYDHMTLYIVILRKVREKS